MNCKDCHKKMDLVDEDPLLGKMWYCENCDLTYIDVGPGNAFDQQGWSK
jgi:hypothetical protein